MSEREELLAKIAASTTAMEKVKELEDQIEIREEKKKKIKGVGKMILAVIAFGVAGSIVSFVFSKIPVIGKIMSIIFSFSFLLPFVLKAIINNKLDGEIAEYGKQLADAQSDAVLNWLPMAYRDSISYQYIASYIQNQRANNLQEAINLFETEKHRANLEFLAAVSASKQI